MCLAGFAVLMPRSWGIVALRLKINVGHNLDLLLAGIAVLLLLFVATYSQRRTWITLGSTALTIVLISAGVLFSTAQGSSQIHDGLAQLAKALPAGLDRPALKLTAALERASTSLARARKQAAHREPQPVLAASLSDWLSWGSWFPAKPEAERKAAPEPELPQAEDARAVLGDLSDAPIKWFLDEPPPTARETFQLSGANLSDQPLEDVQAVLKPDKGIGELALVLELDGRDASGAAVPPGARFGLSAPSLANKAASQLGGAILSFGYVQAGRRKTSIMYLTPPMLAQAAAHD